MDQLFSKAMNDNKKILLFLVLFSLIPIFLLFGNQIEPNYIEDKLATIKMVKDGISEEGIKYQVYSFNIVPSDATYKEIKVKSIDYVVNPKSDDKNVDEVIKVIIDNENSIFTIYQLDDFSTSIKIVFCSVVNENIEAHLLVDCSEKWLGFIDPPTSDVVKELDDLVYDKLTVNDYLMSQFYKIVNNYSSKYTIPCHHFTFEDVEISYVRDSLKEVYVNTIYEDGVFKERIKHEIKDINITSSAYGIEKTAYNFLKTQSGITYLDMINNFRSDYLLWNKELKEQVLSSDGYGLCAKFNVMYSLDYKTRTYELNAYLLIGAKDFVVEIEGIELENNNIIL